MTLASSVYAFLGVLLLRSAMAKLRKPVAFWSILQRYPGGVWFRTARLASLLSTLELVLAGALLLPFRFLRVPAGYCTLAFIILACAGIYARFRRGEERFACGCSGNLEEETAVSSMMIKNGVLLFAVCYAISANWSSGALIDYAMGLALLFAFDLFQTALTMREEVRKWKHQAKFPS